MDLESKYEISSTVDFIRGRKFTRIALQFPDELLKDSPRVSQCLRRKLGKDVRLYVMADAAYGSCCVDEIGASHVDAECVVHYGHACMSRTSNLPAKFVFGKASIDVKDCAKSLGHCISSSNKPIMVLYGLEYAHALFNLKAVVAESFPSSPSNTSLEVNFAEVVGSVMDPSEDCLTEKDQVSSHDDSFSDTGVFGDKDERKTLKSGNGGKLVSGTDYCLGGLHWNIPIDHNIEDYLFFWIGPDNTAFTNVLLTFNTCKIVRYDVDKRCLMGDTPMQTRILRRRYYLVEKAKDANIVGILIGTLGVAGYLKIVQQMKELIKAAGKKSYTLVMGRPNPAKLANFPECDIFVYVSCAQTALLDSKEFLSPVITPFEAVLAFARGRQWTGDYVVNFQDLIASIGSKVDQGTEEARFSFIKGGYVEDFRPQENDKEDEGTLALARATEKTLSLRSHHPHTILLKGSARSGTEFFAARTYQGLSMQFEDPTSQPYVIGRTGRAAGYVDEKRQADDSPGGAVE